MDTTPARWLRPRFDKRCRRCRMSAAFLPSGRAQMALTSAGVCYPMRHHLCPNLIPDCSETPIVDRTRASSLSKAALFAHTTWVTTVARGLCALVAYVLCWIKSLKITEPTLIRERDEREACAFMMMCGPEKIHLLFGAASFHNPAEIGSITDVDNPEAVDSRPRCLCRSISSPSSLNEEPEIPSLVN
ncbi:uncharacterized protein PHACADRAFT_207401 [Phanerochaete carnosa HHB-10118-sp]|uniref:Uncharacterized protein n=1 Tax=Phanerochaete carnosa (strain HHB-10118-sp) TaxID=650164 RepID=K5W3W3_PHACS|nr:uncharacterized protein PHACADRAFT_207401 [Phanerochaete carnosa HHB-10118-sp]EKM58583.1 hypothetical protein PHACADRAFT_207401 [Phanerochaete carnosa HHB-10118-sp]